MSNKLVKDLDEKPVKSKKNIIWIIATLVVLVAAVVIFTQRTKTEKSIELPYQGEDLEISALYQFSGPNPDCNNESEDDIAALTVTNTSERYLKSADITVTLSDKSTYHFYVECLPAGKTAQIFDTSNATYSGKDEDGQECAIKDITVEDEFADKADLMEDQVQTTVEENATEVSITNISNQDINNLVMRCHTLFDGEYFGGLTYTYEVGNITAGGSVIYDATDCYLGTAEVVELTTK